MYIVAEKGQQIPLTFPVADSAGMPVTTDTPYCIAQNTLTKKYFNGIAWNSDAAAKIFLSHFGEGVYVFMFSAPDAGEYKVTMKSDAYGIEKIYSVATVGDNIPTYEWNSGVPFMAKYFPVAPPEAIPNISIFRSSDEMYWDGETWSDSPTEVPMEKLTDLSYMFSVELVEDGRYLLLISVLGRQEMYYAVHSSKSGEASQPVILTNHTVKNLDGSDTTITDGLGIFIKDVSVKVYDAATKEFVKETLSNINGAWQVAVTHGRYIILFEKQGYMSVTVESGEM